MINAQKIKKIMEENGNRLPFLPLDEFFAENPDEYAIAPNQCDDGRPSLLEMYRFFSEIEKQQGVTRLWRVAMFALRLRSYLHCASVLRGYQR